MARCATAAASPRRTGWRSTSATSAVASRSPASRSNGRSTTARVGTGGRPVSSLKAWLCIGLLGLCTFGSAASAASLTLDDLFGREGAADVAVSPSGRYLAAVVRRKDDDVLVLQDLTTGQSKGLTSIGRNDVG